MYIMMTVDLFKYYLIFPKIIFPDFAVFYSTEDLAIELKLEIENILGLTIKFDPLSEAEIRQLIALGADRVGITQS